MTDPAHDVDDGPRRQRVDDANFAGVHLHAPDFERATITDGFFRGANISADIDGLVINGVEVAPLVSAELDRRQPGRTLLRARDSRGLSEAWELIEANWATTVRRALALPEQLLVARVDDEWSFVETLRHLIFATDCWLRHMVWSSSEPYHPWGVVGSFLTEPRRLGLEPSATPSVHDVLLVRHDFMDNVADTIHTASPDELERLCVPSPVPGHPTASHTVLECLHVILNEEWEHCGYANRDLGLLEAQAR